MVSEHEDLRTQNNLPGELGASLTKRHPRR
jgi:hypothetical protein